MKDWSSTFLILLMVCSSVFAQQMTAFDEFQRFWEMRENAFRRRDSSPLLAIDFSKFEGLKYFAFDKNYRLKGHFIETDERKSFLMPTSKGGSRKYLKIGELKFSVDGKELTLGAYAYEWAPDHPKAKEEVIDLFVPFRDLTNGVETYSGGRYVYVRKPKTGDEAILDFNTAYNPNCAYGNDNFACTLPPKENFLQVEIKAGEKKFDSLSGKTTH